MSLVTDPVRVFVSRSGKCPDATELKNAGLNPDLSLYIVMETAANAVVEAACLRRRITSAVGAARRIAIRHI